MTALRVKNLGYSCGGRKKIHSLEYTDVKVKLYCCVKKKKNLEKESSECGKSSMREK